MKIRTIIFALLIASVVLLGQVSRAGAVPPLPSSFWGTATINGQNAPVGATVSAWINGVRYAYGVTQPYQGGTVYALDVPGDDPSTPAIEGGVPGQTIEFRIDGFTSSQTGVWQSGTNVQLNLSVPTLLSTYIPMIRKGGPGN